MNVTINMVKILMITAKMATASLLKINIFSIKGFYVIYSVYDVTNKILSHDSNYIVDVVMWPKFCNSSISIREVIVTSILWRFDQKNRFFWRVVKRVKTKRQKVLLANSYVCRSYRGKTGIGLTHPEWTLSPRCAGDEVDPE